MKEIPIPLPEFELVAVTRVALGAGLGLLLADWLGKTPRRAVGWTLFVLGAAATVPLAIDVYRRARSSASTRRAGWTRHGPDSRPGDLLGHRSRPEERVGYPE